MQYGDYKTTKELGSGSTASVFLAADATRDNRKQRFVVKLCRTADTTDTTWRSSEEIEAFANREKDFRDSATRQKRAHEAGIRYAPAWRGGGPGDQGYWFATDFYPRTAQSLIDGHVGLTREALHHLVHSAVRGAREFKAKDQESHGNIKPSNVLLGGSGNLKRASVVLCDPRPLRADLGSFELIDLRGIGELLYQLVRRRVGVSWPVESSKEWQDVFGEQAPEWVELCHQLLDPSLSLAKLNLESLDERLKRLKPKDSGASLKIAGILVALGVVGVSAWLIFGWISKMQKARASAQFNENWTTAQTAEGNNNLTNALAAYRKAQQWNPTDPAVANKIQELTLKVQDQLRQAEIQNQIDAANAARDIQKNYDLVLTAGRTALGAQQYDEALRQADLALGIKVKDSTGAVQLKAQAQDLKKRAEAAATSQQNYDRYVTAGRKALTEKQYAEAIRQAELALGLGVKDSSAAVQLKATAESQRNLANTAAENQQNYDRTLKLGRTAMTAKRYDEAIRQADAALGFGVTDRSAAIQLKSEAQTQIDLAKAATANQQNYDRALQAGLEALAAQRPDEAIRQAELALGLKVKDTSAAEKLKADAQDQRNRANTAAMNQQSYDQALKAGQAALAAQNFEEALRQANLALGFEVKNPSAAEKLRSTAQTQIDLAKTAKAVQQDYDQTLKAGQTALETQKFDEAIKLADDASKLPVKDKSAAVALKTNAQKQKIQADASRVVQTNYDQAVKAGQTALTAQNFEEAISQADTALSLQVTDKSAAKELKQKAQLQKGLADTAKAIQGNYDQALKSGKTALVAQQYEEAIRLADQALGFKVKDQSAAVQLKNTAQTQLDLANAAKVIQQNYDRTLRAGQTALAALNFDEAIRQADQALGFKVKDSSAAAQLKTTAQTQKTAADAAKVVQQNYDRALAAGQTALAAQNYEEAIRQADQALGFKVKDSSAAAQLKTSAQLQINLAQEAKLNQQNYDRALTAGQAALAAQNYEEAVRQATFAVRFKVKDSSAAVQLKVTAQTQLDAVNTAKLNQTNYERALKAGQNALTTQNFTEAIQQADLALSIPVKDNSAASELKKEAQAQSAAAAEAKARHEEKLAQLDPELHILLVRFGVWNSTDSRLKPTEKARSEKKLGAIGQAKKQYQKRLAALKTSYEGLIQPTGEQFGLIRELEDTIKNWE